MRRIVIATPWTSALGASSHSIEIAFEHVSVRVVIGQLMRQATKRHGLRAGSRRMTYQSFSEWVDAIVLPLRAADAARRRLDGQLTGGNRASAGRFLHWNRVWNVHADTHIDPVLVAYTASRAGFDPFVEAPTASGTSLDLVADLRAALADPRFKYLYIYETR